MMELNRKIDFAIKLLRSIPQDGPIEVSYSTGKDSDVILELAKMAEIPFEAIYKNTTVDPPGSIAHAKEVGATIVQPKKSMLQIIEEKGWPSRWARFCCEHLKEYKIHDRAIQGIRRCESTARSKRYHEPEICRVYNKKEKARIYLPILEWTDADVAQFIKDRGIKCHPYYYDANGNFCVSRRVGCIGCPLRSDGGRGDFKQYPKMFRAWVKAYARWFNSHPDSSTAKAFDSVYNAVYFKMFCEDMKDYNNRIAPPLFAEFQLNAKDYLEQYFKIDLTL